MVDVILWNVTLQLTEEQFTKDLLLNTVSREDLYRLGLRFEHFLFISLCRQKYKQTHNKKQQIIIQQSNHPPVTSPHVWRHRDWNSVSLSIFVSSSWQSLKMDMMSYLYVGCLMPPLFPCFFLVPWIRTV